MAVKKFNFVSPGVHVDEIDNSGRTGLETSQGPVIIGRAERGPALIPVKVPSMSKFIEIFGNPIPGGKGGDIWREGNYTAPAYGTYAAQAWFKNRSPVTFVRLLGATHADATTAGAAGWEVPAMSTLQTGGGAYGLFLVDSGSIVSNNKGTLAAVFYLEGGTIALSGSLKDEVGLEKESTAAMIGNLGANGEFKAVIRNSAGVIVKETAFNFNESSAKFIRKVFNTNPTLTNTTITPSANVQAYWLGETFERAVAEKIAGTAVNSVYGTILGLGNGVSEHGSRRISNQTAKTGWIFSQHDDTVTPLVPNNFQPQNCEKLFRFHGLDNGEWEGRSLKVSIEDIRVSTNDANPYPTFSVALRKVDDSDNAVQFVERFKNVSLDPNANNFISKKIGDMYRTWDDATRSFTEYGDYENQSKFFRVEVNQTIKDGTADPRYMPFGFYGPVRHKGFTLVSGTISSYISGTATGVPWADAFVQGTGSIPRAVTGSTDVAGTSRMTASFTFPSLPLRLNSLSGSLYNAKQAYFGIDVGRASSIRFNNGYYDYVRPLTDGFDTFAAEANTEYSFLFTLDDLVADDTNGTSHAYYTSGSRANGTSISAKSGSNYLMGLEYNKFTLPLVGAFDGVDVTEQDPFRNSLLLNGTDTTNYAYNSVKRAIDSIADPEEVEMNILSVPGMTDESLNNHIITTAESRRDCLAIIDMAGSYTPPSEDNGTSEANRLGSVATVVSNMTSAGYNSSYAATYYPWLRIKDQISGNDLWAPPSISAIGSIAYTEKNKELWYAPAGTNQGGLTQGSGGVPVIGVRQKLKTSDRDALYDARINPIGKFISSGIVIVGQKTLQVQESALDRINVRLLVNYIKKEISRLAMDILFDQNVFDTWLRFKQKADPFLDSIKAGFGLEEAKITIDQTTTTPDLQDRNIVYAKIFLVPAKSIEYIQIDFSIGNSGASFAD